MAAKPDSGLSAVSSFSTRSLFGVVYTECIVCGPAHIQSMCPPRVSYHFLCCVGEVRVGYSLFSLQGLSTVTEEVHKHQTTVECLGTIASNQQQSEFKTWNLVCQCKLDLRHHICHWLVRGIP